MMLKMMDDHVIVGDDYDDDCEKCVKDDDEDENRFLRWTAKTFYKLGASRWSWTKSGAKIITTINKTLQ